MDLLVATTNEGKVRELEALLAPLGVNLRTPRDFPGIAEAAEDGETFEDNALKKARHWNRATGLPTLADDSGLVIDALDGEPGVRSARYAPTVDERNAKVLEKLADVPRDRRTARFVCAAAFIDGQGKTVIENGTCEGLIHDQPEGEGGFGYDPIFWVTEKGKTMAQLDPEEKNLISHRAVALARIRPRLEEWARGEAPPRPGPQAPTGAHHLHYARLKAEQKRKELRLGLIGFGLAAVFGLLLLLVPYDISVDSEGWVSRDEARRSVAFAIKVLLGLQFLLGGIWGIAHCRRRLRQVREDPGEIPVP